MGLYNSLNFINYLNMDFNFIFHLGDIGYDLNSYFGMVGDIFLSKMEFIISKIPYMTIAGNHESFANFSEYKNRFSMPNYNNNVNFFYTIEKPPIKMININTEIFYFESVKFLVNKQIDYLILNLNNTDRKKFPYLIVTGHRPIYCSNKNYDDCVFWQRDILRNKFENLLLKYNVTIYISAHEHSYERICPIYNGSCQNTSSNNKYYLSNLNYTIHITTGAAGCIEGKDNFKKIKPEWSIKRNINKGFGILKTNTNSLLWNEYIVKNEKNILIDNFTIINDYYNL